MIIKLMLLILFFDTSYAMQYDHAVDGDYGCYECCKDCGDCCLIICLECCMQPFIACYRFFCDAKSHAVIVKKRDSGKIDGQPGELISVCELVERVKAQHNIVINTL